MSESISGQDFAPGETEKHGFAVKYVFTSIWRKFLRKLRKRNGEKRSSG